MTLTVQHLITQNRRQISDFFSVSIFYCFTTLYLLVIQLNNNDKNAVKREFLEKRKLIFRTHI